MASHCTECGEYADWHKPFCSQYPGKREPAPSEQQAVHEANETAGLDEEALWAPILYWANGDDDLDLIRRAVEKLIAHRERARSTSDDRLRAVVVAGHNLAGYVAGSYGIRDAKRRLPREWLEALAALQPERTGE